MPTILDDESNGRRTKRVAFPEHLAFDYSTLDYIAKDGAVMPELRSDLEKSKESSMGSFQRVSSDQKVVQGSPRKKFQTAQHPSPQHPRER